jgi:hypothetical protein
MWGVGAAVAGPKSAEYAEIPKLLEKNGASLS